MSNEEIKKSENINTTEVSKGEVPLVVINDLETENAVLRKEIEDWKEKYNLLLKETELLRQPSILKSVALSIPVEKLPSPKEMAIHQKINHTYIQLPNGTQGKMYDFVVDMNKFGLSELKFFELTGLENCGLIFDDETKTIKGIPTSSGDFTIKLKYKFTDVHDNNPFLEKSIPLIINPDPHSLWKNLPSDKSDKYWKADSDSSLVQMGEKRIMAASQRGRSHAQEGKFRDDDFKIDYNDGSKWGFAIVADGAGSAKYARKGSLVACNIIKDYFNTVPTSELQELESVIENFHFDNDKHVHQLKTLLYKHLAGAAYKAYKSLEQEAVSTGSKLKDFGTTIIFAVFKKYDFGWFIASFGVGDSPMGILVKNEKPIIMHYPEEGEYSGQTLFLTMPEVFKDSNEIAARITFKIIPNFKAIFLMTDGVYDPKFQTQSNLDKSELWEQFWEELKGQIGFPDTADNAAEKLLNWLDFWSPGNHDDRTILIIF